MSKAFSSSVKTHLSHWCPGSGLKFFKTWEVNRVRVEIDGSWYSSRSRWYWVRDVVKYSKALIIISGGWAFCATNIEKLDNFCSITALIWSSCGSLRNWRTSASAECDLSLPLRFFTRLWCVSWSLYRELRSSYFNLIWIQIAGHHLKRFSSTRFNYFHRITSKRSDVWGIGESVFSNSFLQRAECYRVSIKKVLKFIWLRVSHD